MPNLLKTCIICAVPKPLEEFGDNGYTRKDKTKGKRNDCRECCNKRRSRYFKDEEKRADINKRRRRTYSEDSEPRRSQNRKYSLKTLYGLTVEQVDGRLAEIDHCCEICGQHESESYRGLKVDHCHDTKENRGMLCQNCNNGLGHFKDDIDSLLRAVEYLLEDKSKKFR
jgi:hypothetical protein